MCVCVILELRLIPCQLPRDLHRGCWREGQGKIFIWEDFAPARPGLLNQLHHLCPKSLVLTRHRYCICSGHQPKCVELRAGLYSKAIAEVSLVEFGLCCFSLWGETTHTAALNLLSPFLDQPAKNLDSQEPTTVCILGYDWDYNS